MARHFQLTDYAQVAGQNLSGDGYASVGGHVVPADVKRNPVQQWGGWLGGQNISEVLASQLPRAAAVRAELSGITRQLRQNPIPLTGDEHGITLGRSFTHRAATAVQDARRVIGL